jgi:ABC-type Fe3+-hydroxamate transport system substrate-binding protein
LKPDLIIGNKEENNQSDIEELERMFPVWMSDINSFEDALTMIEEIGFLTHTNAKAKSLISKINDNFKSCSKIGRNKSVIYYIWDKPAMVAGKNTFIDSILSKFGFVNLIQTNRYPHLEKTTINGQPDYLFLSSEPYPFSIKHVQKFQELYPNTKILLVDGEMFSWYGSRLILAPENVKNLLL